MEANVLDRILLATKMTLLREKNDKNNLTHIYVLSSPFIIRFRTKEGIIRGYPDRVRDTGQGCSP